MKILRAFALLCCCVFVMGNVGVPVIIFKDLSVTSTMPKPLAGHTIATSDFSDLLKLFAKPDLTITFIQDELSNEDFLRLDKDMKRGGLFQNVQKYSDLGTSIFFPSVKSPAHSLNTLTVQYDEQLTFTETDKVVSYLTKTKLQAGTAVIIHLLPTADEETSSQAIKQNDAMIGEVMHLVEETGLSYIAVFTAKLHRRVHEAVVGQGGVGRHLLEANATEAPDPATSTAALSTKAPSNINNTIIFRNSTDCMVYLQDLYIDGKPQYYDNTDISCKYVGEANTSVVIGGKNQSAAMTVTIEKKGELADAILMTFKKDVITGYWYLANTTMGKLIVKPLPDISAPIDFSYNCNEPTFFRDSSNATVILMQFQRIQIQLFDFEKVDVFGNAYDCTGFFTIPLWTGLFISLFLIIVTGYGLSMLASIQTFDQYDDPKSKPLIITVSE